MVSKRPNSSTSAATGAAALASQAATGLAALEGGVSRLSVSTGTYNFLNTMGQPWAVNQVFLDSNALFGSRFIMSLIPPARAKARANLRRGHSWRKGYERGMKLRRLNRSQQSALV